MINSTLPQSVLSINDPLLNGMQTGFNQIVGQHENGTRVYFTDWFEAMQWQFDEQLIAATQLHHKILMMVLFFSLLGTIFFLVGCYTPMLMDKAKTPLARDAIESIPSIMGFCLFATSICVIMLIFF